MNIQKTNSKVFLMIVLLAFAFLPLASSSIFIEPLQPIYNYGDQINVQTTIVPSVTTSSHYTVDLKCENDFSSNIFNSFFEIGAGIERQVLVATQLINPEIYNLTGPCFLRASFGNEAVNSNSFTLSKEINVEAELAFESLNPSNTFSISGTAIKESGARVNGFAELFIPALNLYKSSVVTDGAFNLSLVLPANVKSGVHNYSLEIHDTDYNSRKINFGDASGTFSIGQILKQVSIHFETENAKPESDFIFRVDAIDQAGDPIVRDVSLTVSKPKGVPYIKKVIKSGENQKIALFLNDTPGYWSIETDVEGIQNRKLFYLAEVSTIQTSLINDTLIVANVGNAPYSGALEITIGSTVEIKQIRLGVGENQRLKIRAPDGEYKISVADKAGETKELGSAFLTGNAVKVTDFREDVIYTFTNPLIWWLGVALLILIIVLVQIKIRMQRKSPTAPKAPPVASRNMAEESSKIPMFTPSPTKNSMTDISANSSKFDMSWFNKPKAPPVQPSVSPFAAVAPKVSPAALFGTQNQGIRERACAIALYVGGNSSNASDTLNRSLSIAHEVGAKAYLDGEYKIILFSPRLTHVPDNEMTAVNVARRIQALFLEHLRMYNDGLTFGIGISDGEIISEIEGGKFHFTSTGNLISYAKRLAHASNGKLLVSDSLRRKVITTVRTEKSVWAGVWEVVKVTDRSPNSELLKRFSAGK